MGVYETCTPGTDQGVHFINLPDQSSPIFAAGFTEFLKFGIGRFRRFRLAGRMADLRADAVVVAACLVALSTTFVAEVAVVANGLFPSVGDMAGQGGQPVQGRPPLLGTSLSSKGRR